MRVSVPGQSALYDLAPAAGSHPGTIPIPSLAHAQPHNISFVVWRDLARKGRLVPLWLASLELIMALLFFACM